MTEHSKIYTESILRSLEESENGFFQIESIDGFAYLKVTKPGKQGESVKLTDVIDRLKLFGIKDYKNDDLKKIVHDADGKDHKIAKWSDKSEDMKVEIEASEDGMSAFISIIPPKHGGRQIGADEIIARLQGKNITAGILKEEIQNSLKEENYFQKILVAKGMEPKNGRDGYIKILFDSGNKPDLHEDQSGKMDFKNTNIIKSVEKDTVIAEMVKATDGEFGTNIYGGKIPFESAKDANWKIGTNTTLSPDGKNLIATITGRPVLERNGTIRVDEVCTLENVDYSTGNVDFPGTIIVEGSVVDGFKLQTKGSIILKNSVGRVFLHASGDIILSGGFMGKNGGVIESEGDIYAKFVEQGKISALGSIFIQEAAMHSELFAGGSIVINGGKGELIGGEAVAGKNISVLKLGAIVETPTKVSVGIPPTILIHLDKINKEISEKEDIFRKIEQSKKKLSDAAKKNTLSKEDKEMLEKLYEVEKKIQFQLKSLRSQYEIAVTSFEPEEDAYAEIEQSIFPKVEINLGKGKFFRSEIKTYTGKNTIFLGSDGNVSIAANPPKKNKKKELN